MPKLPSRLLLSALQDRVHDYWEARLPRQNPCTLNHRRLYILPTRAGWMLLVTLVILLLASINYQINLGYLLTFMLAGAATIGMYVCHGNLRGLTLSLQEPAASFAGQAIRLHIQLHNPSRRTRYGIGLKLRQHSDWSWTDATPGVPSSLELRWVTLQRGWHDCPSLEAETRFPLGTFRVWAYWRPAQRILVYPQPEAAAPTLPSQRADDSPTDAHTSAASNGGEPDGLRPYRRGDSLKQIAWKPSAKSQDLLSRAYHSTSRQELWLDYRHSAGIETEARLSRLCAWVLMADAAQLRYGLRLPQREIPLGQGPQQRLACLQALAEF